MSASHEPFDTLAQLHAVGALDGDELRRFQAHVAGGCARCETTVREAQEMMARAAMGEAPVAPPAHIRWRSGPVRRLPWAVGTAAAALAAAALSAAYVAARYEARLGEMAREQVRVKEALARNETILREQAALYRGAVELLRDPASRVVELRGQATTPTAVARVVWQDASGGLLFAANLPPAPAGKAYELWTIAGAAPRAAGIFTPDATGGATVAVPATPPGPPVKIFAVTLEPEGGVEAPTGPVVLTSK